MFPFTFLLLLVQLFENSMAFMYALLVIDAGFSNIELGLLLAIPAAAGFMFDLLLSRFALKFNWKTLFQGATLLAVVFAALLYFAIFTKSFIAFLFAGIAWYVYYELFCLMQQQYVVQEYTKAQFSRIWGILYITMQVGWVIGPILGALALSKLSENAIVLHGGVAILVTFVLAILPISKRAAKLREENEQKEQLTEPKVSTWKLFMRILPVASAYVLMLLITELFQNIGGVYGEELQLGREWAWLVISIFAFALAIGPIFLSKFAITRGKKYLSLLLLAFGGAFLFSTFFINNIILLLFSMFCSGLAVSVALPLEEAVFSDFEKRSPKERASLMMLVRLVASIAYIISPLLGGFFAELWGYKVAFAALGGIVFVGALTLRLFTPAKIKIPHAN